MCACDSSDCYSVARCHLSGNVVPAVALDEFLASDLLELQCKALVLIVFTRVEKFLWPVGASLVGSWAFRVIRL